MFSRLMKTVSIRAALIAIVIGINFILFIILPTTHELLKRLKNEDLPETTSRRIVAEMVRPPEKKQQKPKQRRIRQVKSSSAKSGGSSMKFKFTPDLGVEGGQGVAIQAQNDMEAVVFQEGETDQEAVPMYTPAPPYPDRARELGIEGEVEAVFVVNIDGSVSSVDITRSPHPTISSAVRKTIEDYKFKPAMNQGVPVRVSYRRVFEFTTN